MPLDLTQFGVQTTGFVKLRQDQAVGDIFDSLETAWGTKLDRDPNSSFIAGLVYIIADRFASLYEVGEGVYNAMYPSTAQGVSLENAVSFVGMQRKDEVATTAYQTFLGTEGAVVPLGTQVQNQASGDAFQTVQDVTITALACNYLMLTPNAIQNSTKYSVTIDGNEFSYTSSSAATVTEIINNLAAQVAKYGLTTVTNGAELTLSTLVETTHAIVLSSNLSSVTVGSPVMVMATQVGPIVADAGMLTDLASTISGVDGTVNYAAASPGRYQENDSELRQRHQAGGNYSMGAATQNAILANLADVAGVIMSNAIVNSTSSTTADGVPAKSVAAVVVGGSDLAIAQALFSTVAGGIGTYGSTSVTLQDREGNNVVVSFSRPQPVYVWVKVTTTLLAEEVFPVDGYALIESAIVASGNALVAGNDVITQRFIGPVFAAASGMATVTVAMYSNTDPTAAPTDDQYSTSNISISAFQQAAFDTSRVVVNG